MRAYTLPASPPAPVPPAAFWNEQVRDNSDALYQSIRRIAYINRTSNYTTTATTITAATDIFSSDISFTADGTSSYLVEFYASRIVQPAASDSFLSIVLTDGGNNGRGALSVIGVTNGDSVRTSVLARTFIQFSAGTVTLNCRGVVSTGTGELNAGSGGTSATSYFPAYLSVYGPDLT